MGVFTAPPEIENSTREERQAYIYEKFQCKANCEICGLCAIYKGKPLEVVYDDYIEGKRSFLEIAKEYRR